MGDLSKFVARMRYWCDEANLGYSQPKRWDIRPGGSADCSSLVIHCLKEAGFYTGAATYTGNIRAALTAAGWRVISPNGTPWVGDILLNDGHHVAACVAPGLISEAAIDENGTIWGAMSGDQTGRETRTRSYYSYPWSCYLRYTGAVTADTHTTPATNVNTIKAANPALSDIEETIMAMKATHIIFQHNNGNKGALYLADVIGHTYQIIPDTKTLSDLRTVIERAGGVVKEWKEFNAAKTNIVSNINAFGKEIK